MCQWIVGSAALEHLSHEILLLLEEFEVSLG